MSSIPSLGVERQLKGETAMNACHSVKDFGAVGDGSTPDTKAIQKALDSGGIVYFPPGVYRSGTIYLRSHGGILLDAGATLQASPDLSDYNADDFCPQNRVLRQELVSGRHLVVAVEQEHITISGAGRIDGNYSAWLNEPDPAFGGKLPYFKRDPERPGQMIYLCECSDVRIRDVELTNASYWHCFLHGCENVTISGVHIYGVPGVINNDGLDIDCCQRVTISDCIIETADDCIALRSDPEPLKKSRACEYVAVSNCVLSSDFANAIRVGVGNGEIRRCNFSNIVIHRSRTGICIVSRYWEADSGANISELDFNGLQLHVKRPFNIKLDNSASLTPPGARRIGDIRFSNISGTAFLSSYLTGTTAGRLERIKFSNVSLRYGGNGPAPDKDANGHWGCGSTDAAFELAHVDNATFNNVEIRFECDAQGWNHDISAKACRGLARRDCDFAKGVIDDKSEGG